MALFLYLKNKDTKLIIFFDIFKKSLIKKIINFIGVKNASKKNTG